MKPRNLLHASLSLLLAGGASAQGVTSQMGGFSEQVAAVPTEATSSASDALSLFLQQTPEMPGPDAPPTFSVASPLPIGQVAAPTAPVAPVVPAVPASPSASPSPAGPNVQSWSSIQPMPSKIEPPLSSISQPRPRGKLTLRSIRVANPGAEGSKIFFGDQSQFAVGTDAAGNFQIQQAAAQQPLLTLDPSNTLHLGSARVEALSLDAMAGISVRGVKQWQLVHSEDFSTEGAGWSRRDVTQCAGVSMLGGFCKFSKGEVNKTFANLPPHKQLRIVATYHFIDRWIGETGYMKLNVGMSDCPVTVWSDRHMQQEVKNGLSLCGNVGTPEGKFAAPVDVTVPHHKDSVTVSFGSTMDDADPCDESWGISSFEIHIRD